MPLLSPPTVDVGTSQYGNTAGERAILRISSPMKVGKTLIKRGNGQWYCKRSPTQRELDGALMFFLGGHVYEVSQSLVNEILASVGPDCTPTITPDPPGSGTFPSSATYPSSSLYPSGSVFPSASSFPSPSTFPSPQLVPGA